MILIWIRIRQRGYGPAHLKPYPGERGGRCIGHQHRPSAAAVELEVDGVEGAVAARRKEEGRTGSGGRTRGGGGRAAVRVGRWGAAAERDRGEVGERRVGLASEGTGELWIRQWWTGLGRIV